MHSLLTTHTITVEINEHTLFSGVSLSVPPRARIGLVGPNGSGKSTLLKVINGQIEPTSGGIDTSATSYYLPQIDLSLFESDESVNTYCSRYDSEWKKVEAELHRLFKCESIKEGALISTISGGELMMLNIAIGSIRDPDILLLDEPTNHLDVVGLRILEQYLATFSGACIVVSHDPLFLDRTVSRIWAIEHQTVEEYGGNYSAYQEALKAREETRRRSFERERKALKRQRGALEKTETRAARAEREQRRIRADDAKDKFTEGFFKDRSEQSAGKHRVRFKEEMEETKEKLSQLKPIQKRKVHVGLIAQNEGRKQLCSVDGAALSINGQVLVQDIHLQFQFGDRVAVLGKNGSGKSSLLQALVGLGAGTLTPPVRVNATSIVYVDQKYRTIDQSKTVLENIEAVHSTFTTQEARDHLAKFMFAQTADVKKRASVLSGGEAARLTLAMVTAVPVDLLILDEPTNNLDIETLDSITDGLSDFQGGMVVISHNVHFLQRLGVNRAYCIVDGQLKLMMTTPQDPEPFYSELVKIIT